MSSYRKAMMTGLAVTIATLAACAQPPSPPLATRPVGDVPLPNVHYYPPPAATTRANADSVPVGSAICPTVARFGSPNAGAVTAGCTFR